MKPFFAKSFLLGLHRGGRSEWPENTAEAYRLAAARWPEALLEGDVQMTSDGHVIVLHDDTVDRTTDGKGPIAEMTLAQAKALDAGYRFTRDGGQTFPYRGKGITIPTFAEVLAVAPNSRFLIEMKNQRGIADAMVKVLRDAHALERVVLASFNPALMERACQLEPSLLHCYDVVNGPKLLVELRANRWQAYTPAADVLALDDDLLEGFRVQPAELRAIREKGIAVIVFTINDPAEMRKYLDVGVDCVLTDEPEILARLIAPR